MPVSYSSDVSMYLLVDDDRIDVAGVLDGKCTVPDLSSME